jgi:hypothetical protein
MTVFHHRNPAATGRHDQSAALDQPGDRLLLKEPQWPGGGDHPAITALGVRGHCPVPLGGQPPSQLFVEERPDRLGRAGKCRVVSCDHNVGDHAHHSG